jgi:hypothetical protein
MTLSQLIVLLRRRFPGDATVTAADVAVAAPDEDGVTDVFQYEALDEDGDDGDREECPHTEQKPLGLRLIGGVR